MNGPAKIEANLRRWLSEHRPLDAGDVIVSELCFLDKRNRADLVHANGLLSAFEIKSAADTLVRWREQMAAYLQVFDEVWLCFHSKHAARAIEASAPRVGLLVADDLGAVAVVRTAKRNTSVSAYHLTGLLWRSELDNLSRAHGLPVHRRESIKEARQRASQLLPLDVIRTEVLRCLKSRYTEDRS